MGLLQRVADKDAILIGLEDGLTLQHYTAYTVDGGRHQTGIKLTDVLVSLRTEVVALILVEAQVELCSVLDDRTVERRQEHMVLVVNLRYGYNQQTMVLARITVYKGRAAIGARPVGSEQFTAQ
jgi:hypothetical protein